MANVVLTYIGPSGHTDFVATIQRLSDSFYSPAGGGSFSNSLTFAQKQILLTEQTGDNGKYRNTVDATSWVDDEYCFSVLTSGNQSNLASTNFWTNGGIECGPSGNCGVIWNAQISNYQLAGSFGSGINRMGQDAYFANIKFINDSTVPENEYTIGWFRNSQILISGQVSNPAISVYKTSDGTAVISNRTLTWAGANIGALRYNETVNVLSSGEPYLVVTSGTIDGSVRSWSNLVGLDYL